MNKQATKIRVFVVYDPTMGGNLHRIIKKHIGELQEKIKNTLPVDLRFILMGRDTQPVSDPLASITMKPSFNAVLAELATALQSGPPMYNRVFIIVHDEFSDTWDDDKARAILKGDTTISFLWFDIRRVSMDTQKTLATYGKVFGFSAASNRELQNAFEDVYKKLRSEATRIEQTLPPLLPDGPPISPHPTPTTPDSPPRPTAEPEIPVLPAQSPPPQPTKEGGVATIWQELDPDRSQGDWVEHLDKATLPAGDQWSLVAASIRGKIHAHHGKFREDAFRIGTQAGWHLMVVCDGGGSCPLSRVGSQLAADTGVDTMQQFIAQNPDLPDKEQCDAALKAALRTAWEALEAESKKRDIPLGHLGTTFLAVMHKPGLTESLVGVIQVGDGLVVAGLPGQKEQPFVVLANPDVGESASMTFFLTSKHWQEWIDRGEVRTITTPAFIAAMCDGVADDFIPFEKYLHVLLNGLDKVIGETASHEDKLLELLDYDKRGSFDDRTLALIYQKNNSPASNRSSPSAMEVMPEPPPSQLPGQADYLENDQTQPDEDGH